LGGGIIQPFTVPMSFSDVGYLCHPMVGWHNPTVSTILAFDVATVATIDTYLSRHRPNV